MSNEPFLKSGCDAPEVAGGRPPAARAFLVSLRPWEWSKNVFVFTGLLFAYRFRDLEAIGNALLAFAVFCGLSGIAYVINDWHDREQDREHPQKRLRPIARGHLGAGAAAAGVVVVALAVAAGGALLGWTFAAWGAAYFFLNVAYSLWLKHVIFLDLVCLATGFLIRVYAGCAAVEVPTSGYAVSCAFSLALLLGAGKRRAELLAHGEESARHRSVLDHYTPRMLDVTLGVAVAATLASYVVFVLSHKHPPAMMATVVLVGFGVYRYLRLLYGGKGADQPARLVWGDRALLLTCVCWVLVSVGILWVSGHELPR
ncbi:MAG: UbiA prenyltransferase family protein [Verrucomicrobia bacterium]|nr:UbiA prenyltransferase family protein [Verrucomicrobiota bacterium]